MDLFLKYLVLTCVNFLLECLNVSFLIFASNYPGEILVHSRIKMESLFEWSHEKK